MADEEILTPDNDVTIAIRDLLSELYPVRERFIRDSMRACCIPVRNVILDNYRAISANLKVTGFDTTELDNTIAAEQVKTDTLYHP